MREITPRLTTEVRFRIDLPAQDLLDLLTAAYKFEVERRKCKFILDENTQNILINLVQHLTLPVPKIGIMCCGTCGNGKTTLLYALRRVVNYLNDRHHFDFLNDDYTKFNADLGIYKATDLINIPTDSDTFKQLKWRSMLAIDDLGTESLEKRDFGNIITPVVELLGHRYDKQLFTFITTNLVGKEIRTKYKNRIADRLNEMLHVIVFKDKSYRTPDGK